MKKNCVKLGSICTFQSGGTPSRGKAEYYNGYIPWITTVALNGGYIDQNSAVEWITDEAIRNSAAKIVPAYSMMVGTRVGIGKASINRVAMATSQDVISLLDIDDKVWSKEYLLWFIRGKSAYLQSQSRGATIKGVNIETVSALDVPKLPSEEQKELAGILKRAENLMIQRRKQLAAFDTLIKARFVEMFIGKEYSTKTIDEVSLGKGEYGAQSASVKYDSNRPRYVRITDINDDGTLNDEMVTSINPDDDEQYRLEYGDFMFARMGATVGKTYAFITGDQIFAGYLIRYKLNQKLINPRYLFWYTKLDVYWNWVKLSQSGAAQPSINAKKYGSLRIPVPPIELQEQFAAFVAQVDKSKFGMLKDSR